MRFILSFVLFAFIPNVCLGLEVKEVRVNYRRFHPTARLLEIPGFRAKEAVNLGLNTDLIGPFYWDNVIKSLTDDGGYRYIAWNLFLGVRVFQNFRIEYEHESGHYIDHDQAGYITLGGRHPVQDSIGFQWYLHLDPTPGKSIF
jgi:hypothetical protein